MNQSLHLPCPNQSRIEVACFEQNTPLCAANQVGDVLEPGVGTLQDFNNLVRNAVLADRAVLRSERKIRLVPRSSLSTSSCFACG